MAMSASALRDALLLKVDFEAEFRTLLGDEGGKGRRACPFGNHTNNKSSLSYSTRHGGWRCMACGEKGDLFTLFKKILNANYSQALMMLCDKYGVTREITSDAFLYSKDGKREARFPAMTDQTEMENLMEATLGWTDEMKFYLKEKIGRAHV